MKKSIILAATIAAMFAACANDNDITPTADTKTIAIEFQGDVDFTIAPFETRTVTDARAMTDIWIMDYMDGQCRQAVHQSACDIDFGRPSITFAYGTHDLYIVASAGQDAEVIGTGIEWQTVGDTFWRHVTLKVDAQTMDFLSIVLSRVATALRVQSIDNVPTAATSVTIQPDAWYTALDFITGEPTSGTESPILRYDQLQKSAPLDITLYGFAPATGNTMRARIKTYSAIGVIKESTAPTFPISANHVTTLSGTLFGSTLDDATGIHDIYYGVQMQVTWGAGYDVEI